MRLRRRLAGQVQLLGMATLVACSGGGGNQVKNPAIADLEAGLCPNSIVYSSGKAPGEDQRYGPQASYSDIAHYRDRELQNCQQQLAAGDLDAMTSMMGAVTPGLLSIQANAVCPGVTPSSAASAALRSTMSRSHSRW